MGRPLIHLMLTMVIIAMVFSLLSPSSPTVVETPKSAGSTRPFESLPLSQKRTGDSHMWLSQTLRKGLRRLAAAPAPLPEVAPVVEAAHEPPQIFAKPRPQPSGLWPGDRPKESGLSVRGLTLDMSRTAADRLGPLNVSEPEFWKKQATRPLRNALVQYSFQESYANFDGSGLAGSVSGNGLERSGVPILAKGDTGPEVERLLGRPSQAEVDYGGGRGTVWIYRYSEFTLWIGFWGDRVIHFHLEANDLVVPGC